MIATAADVLAGRSLWAAEQGDALAKLQRMRDNSVDLIFGSPPYEDLRTYGLNADGSTTQLRGQAWVDWMLLIFRESVRVCRGLVAFVVAGKTNRFRWSATPALLMADLHRSGFNVRNPPLYHRVGVPGSGGPDWLRADYEWIVCVSRPGKLHWSDNTACGGDPKYAKGGEMSHRTKSGGRVGKGSYKLRCPQRGGKGDPEKVRSVDRSYTPPAKTNPGNVIHCVVGGGRMGHVLASENEAPFALTLPEFFARSYCPPGGVVLDPFCGSGTTLDAAIRHGRAAVGYDLRPNQVKLTRRRLVDVEELLKQQRGKA
jgi:site-specific DNA-methyltransferase (adenine-specific)